MTWRRALWVLIGLVTAASLAFAALSGDPGPEANPARVERLALGVRCPTCQGLSAAESDAKAATAVRAEIARRVEQGQSDEQIRQALVDRYGREILLVPEGEGIAALVWAVPVGVVVVAAFGLGVHLIRRGRQSAAGYDRSPPALVRRAVVGLAVLAAAVGAGVAVARTAGERLPGDSATGSLDRGPAELLVQARSHLQRGEAVDALRLYDQVLEEDAAHPEALAYRGWLVRLAGDTDQAMDLIDTAIAADPDYADAHLFKGVILLEDLAQPAAAAAELRRFLVLDPDSALASEARQRLAEAEAAVA